MCVMCLCVCVILVKTLYKPPLITHTHARTHNKTHTNRRLLFLVNYFFFVDFKKKERDRRETHTNNINSNNKYRSLPIDFFRRDVKQTMAYLIVYRRIFI